MENVHLKMKKIDKSADSSPSSCLPDDILFQILRRLIDLKTLCRCKLVSIRFNHTVQQVDAISVTITSVDRPTYDSNSSDAPSDPDRPIDLLLKCDSFVSVTKYLRTFNALKSLCIAIPPFHRAKYNDFLFKWKFEYGNRTASLLFLSPNSVCDTKENVQDEEEQEEENVELSGMKLINAVYCMGDNVALSNEMRYYLKCFPLLANVNITDTSKRGRLSLCGQDIVCETIEQTLESISIYQRLRWCYIPLLKLPVSGYMMKGVFIAQGEVSYLPFDDSYVNMNFNDFEDKEDATYSEAVMEIFKKNRVWIEELT